jgi:predicted amidohydrolase
METFTVAGAQMRRRGTIGANALAVAEMVRRAAERGASFLVTPEMILTGYHAGFSQPERDWTIEAILKPACRRHRITLLVGAGSFRDSSGRRARKPFIQTVVIGPDGEIAGVHSKTIPTDGDLKWCSAGRPRDLRVFRSGNLKFGATICNDFWATPGYTSLPDLNLPVRLAALGARVVFHSIASGHGTAYRDFHTKRMEERAIRAGIFVVSANCAENSRRPVNAPSGIVDPKGRWTVRAPLAGERLFTGKIRI